MTAQQIVNRLIKIELIDEAGADGSIVTRRMIRDERMALQTAISKRDARLISEHMHEAQRVAAMYGYDLA